MAGLNLLANLGLILFLLLMGLELDLGVVAKRAKTSLAISLTGIVGTFALSLGVSKFFYTNIPGLEEQTSYTSFLLFIGVAMSVTALPVLARILTERNLLKTPVGVTVISAAAVDDATGWSFLALVVSLVSASSPVTIVYIILGAVALALFQFLVMKPVFLRLNRYFTRTDNNEEHELSEPMVVISFVWCLLAAFYTEALGIHAIFGAFLTGLILPRENGFAIKLTERLEELVTVLLLPLYFTYSGLRTNIGAMNDGLSWGCFFLVWGIIMVGKIGGCSLAARFMGNTWRESVTIGCLMNTKGLVELIILNIGLDAGVMNAQTFAIMVLLAIATTVTTTPLVTWLYPPSYYNKQYQPSEDDILKDQDQLLHPLKHDMKLVVCVPNISSVPSLMTFVEFLSPSSSSSTTTTTSSTTGKTIIHAVRLLPLTDRMSHLLLAVNQGETIQRDPALNVFKTFGNLRDVAIHPHVILSEGKDFAREVGQFVGSEGGDMVVIPWHHASKTVSTVGGVEATKGSGGGGNLWTQWFGAAAGGGGQGGGDEGEGDSTPVGDIAYLLMKKCRSKVGVLVDRGYEGASVGEGGEKAKMHVLVPFFGGPDDREAVLVGLRMKGVVVSVVVFRSFVGGVEKDGGEGEGEERELVPLDPDDETLLEFVGRVAERSGKGKEVGGGVGGEGGVAVPPVAGSATSSGSFGGKDGDEGGEKVAGSAVAPTAPTGDTPVLNGSGSNTGSDIGVTTPPTPDATSPSPPQTPHLTLTTIHTHNPTASVLAELSKRDYGLTIVGHFGPGWGRMMNRHAGNVVVGTNEAANEGTVWGVHGGDVGIPLARTATQVRLAEGGGEGAVQDTVSSFGTGSGFDKLERKGRKNREKSPESPIKSFGFEFPPVGLGAHKEHKEKEQKRDGKEDGGEREEKKEKDRAVKVLGPVGAAILRGGVGRSGVLSLRKVRVSRELREE
ncbi:K(+)/H(+) antiporter [Rhizophlyctis rosea]|nr:K(+)/H(+) antiporter [Rhizophlyctis rosea]